MPAYFIVDNEVTDPAGFEDYRKKAPGAVEKYGGKFLVRGGQMHTLEGDWKPRCMKALRLRTARGSVVLVEGVS